MPPKIRHGFENYTYSERLNCSESAWYAINQYWSRYHPAGADTREENAINTDQILGNFCAGRENYLLYDAVVLSEIASGIFRQESLGMPTIIEKEALRTYFDMRQLQSDEEEYMYALLADRIKLEVFWSQQATDLYHDHPEINRILNQPYSDKTQIKESRIWSNPVEIIDVNKMFELADCTNLESLLGRSAQNIAWMLLARQNAQNFDQSLRMLRSIAETESLLAPVAEIIGFHKMAMVMNDICAQTRLLNGGNGWSLEAAQSVLDDLPTGEALNREVEQVFKELFGDNYHDDVTGLTDPKYFMREGALESNTMLDKIFRTILRRKTKGSLARKLFEYYLINREGIPMDIIGGTIIVEDESQIPELFSQALRGISTNPEYSFHPSPSREHAVHIQGKKEFYEQFPLDEIREIAGSDWGPLTEDGFQVAKITFFHHGIPFEIQIITEAGRVENNLGERTSHVGYKIIKSAKARRVKEELDVESRLEVNTTGWGEKMTKLNSRNEHMGEVGIHPKSAAAAEIFRESLLSPNGGMGGITKKLTSL
jgi:hypothetical protein